MVLSQAAATAGNDLPTIIPIIPIIPIIYREPHNGQ